MVNVTKIPWEDILHAVPAFLTIVIMPLTYSIAYGAARSAFATSILSALLCNSMHHSIVTLLAWSIC